MGSFRALLAWQGAQGRKIGIFLKFEISNLRSAIEIMERRGD
jgi:hypothetical protein